MFSKAVYENVCFSVLYPVVDIIIFILSNLKNHSIIYPFFDYY